MARTVNADPTVRGKLKVVFLPNYNVSLAEMIIPAVDLSEQISTAGMEASGTGNMKMALNGALIIGTLDGANVELRDLVGDPNIFIFGLTAAEVEASRRRGIDSSARIAASPILRETLDGIGSGVFSADDRGRYKGLVETLTHHDYFMVCADFDAYWATQVKIVAAGAPQGLATLQHHKYGKHRLVFVGSHDRRICDRDLERALPAHCLKKEIGMAENWRAREEDIDAIAAAREEDPFAILGPHLTPDGWASALSSPTPSAFGF